MEAYKQEFIDFMVESDVLKFGDFTLKSGRKSPFFMNAGAYVTGTQLLLMLSFMVRKCVIVQTARKKKIMVQIRADSLEAS